MSTLVKSLKRLYLKSQLVRNRVDALYQEGKLSQEEYYYIIASE